jgi:4-amino-4-deoxy-L-arabinose transferase-like glycosyltransferase
LTRIHAVVLVGALGFYCALAPALPAADDEFYYWCWAKDLQLSYYDHPPMSAYMIRLSIEVFGDSQFAIRFPACLTTAFVVGAVLYLTPGRVTLWLAAVPLFTLGGILMTPDTPLLLFWSAYLLWLVAVHRRLTPEPGENSRLVPVLLWVLGGVVLGCGVLGKYTAGLAGIAGFLSFVVTGGWRKWIAGYILHGVVAFIVASPILIYNIRHDFQPLAYQWEHAMASGEPGLKPFGEFVGVQVLLFGTLPFALLPWAVWNYRSLLADPRLRVCLFLYGFPLSFFLFKAARGPLEGNWALASYIAFWPVAGVWWAGRRSSWMLPSAFVVPALVTLVAAVHLAYPLWFIPPSSDRVTRQGVKFEVCRKIRDRIAARGEQLPIYVETYQMAARLRFLGLDARQVDGVSRPSHFTQLHEHPSDSRRGYIVWEGFPKAHQIDDARIVEIVEPFPVVVGEQTQAYYMLFLFDSAIGQPCPPDNAVGGRPAN